MCLNGWCPNLKLRYSLGKKAQKNTQVIDELLQKGKDYARVYNIKTPLKVRSPSTELFKDFESRKSTIQNVLNALKNDDINMIALWGMAGVGKTKMAKEIKRIVESDNLFHKVAITVVSQNPNFIKIQGELAESLGTRLQAEFLHGRANELYSILTETKKVLLILDDVWKPLDIEDIGVYQAIKEKSCKILLTTRNEETCNGKSIRPKIFPVELLSEEEAWNLFKEMVGDYINASDLISIAEQVAKECARLPLAIAVVGSALRNKSDKNEWKAVLQQLKMSMLENIFDLQAKVYSSIGFSYNYLESNEAKSCFLLCCLYPEDYDVPVEHLVRYGVAKRFFNGLDTVEETRVHVCAIVQNLRRSNLLLDGNKAECVKMHDVVRDVVISIASKEENGFMVNLDKGLKDWPPMDRSYDSYTAISLLLREMKGHPIELKCPKLQLLRLSCLNHSKTFPYNFFNGMKELKMLSMQEGCFSLTLLPPSIQIFQNLQMLNLQSCRLGDVSAIGTLGNLEILGFPNSDIEELQSEIGNLSRLKLLDMKGCDSLKRIAAGVLSGLSRLEELYVGRFRNWACKTTMEGNGEVTNDNASLAELIPYSSQLVVLEISVPSILCLQKELHFSNSNFRFKIKIGADFYDSTAGRYFFENTLKLGGEDASDLREHQTICSLVKNAVVLHFDIAKNSKHIWFGKEQKGINLPYCLEDLKICRCENLEYLLEATSNSTPPNTFHRLVSVSLNNLPRLIGICNSTESIEVERGGSTTSKTIAHKLFSSDTILWVPKLGSLNVEGCRSLEVIFDLEGLEVKENPKPFLAELSNLHLWDLSGMAHVWKNISPGFQGFKNLISIDILRCHSLNCLAIENFYLKHKILISSLQLSQIPIQNIINNLTFS
ncbi:probable disease resistance protein At4g27220 [Carya illinoinensis]|uniref:probable disease resistance protein At4g27220 n=1 Tax=Carya illinoinensis TaxID=32201 RepID=UPI001C719582|nr:probable disease resistance protein At4g27220 [Carya illinoinensis]